VNWQSARFPTDIVESHDHGTFGRYSGKASSEREADDAQWTVLLSHRSQVVHTLAVGNRRRAEYLLHAWTRDRIAPDLATAAEVQA
jgi:hypothetical protein